MYNALDSFLDVETWHTFHPMDEGRFFCALAQIVKDPAFSPIKMSDYIRQHGNKDGLREEVIENNVEHYSDAAIAVDKYLRAIGEKQDY